MSKYLAALKGKDFAHPAREALQEVQEAPSYSFCSSQVSTPQKYQAPESNAQRTATPAEAAELRVLIERLLADCPAGIEETVQVAVADVDDALVCFRALVADLPPPASALPVLPTCEQCSNLSRSRDGSGCRRCTAAGRGELPGAHSRYCPDPSSPRRCLGFAPLTDADDQRPGAERWPWLAEAR